MDVEAIRGISLRRSLRNFGQLWRHSPVDMVEQEGVRIIIGLSLAVFPWTGVERCSEES